MAKIKFLITLLTVLFNTSLIAQAPANSLGGYANVDNNPNKIPRIFLGVSPLIDYGQGLGLRAATHLKIRGDRWGELQFNGTFTPDFLVTVPKKPFGPTYKCNCTDNNFNPYTELEGSYTYYFNKKEVTKNYRVILKTKPTATLFPKPSISLGEHEDLPGKKNYLLGVRLGAAYQNSTTYLLSEKRMLAYTGLDQIVAFAGISRTSLGRMYKKFDEYGTRGKNVYHQFYLDGFYATGQNFTLTPVAIYNTKGELQTEEAKGIPYGARIGFTNYHFGFRSTWAWYSGIELGVRPTFDNMTNGVYASFKLGIGIGTGKTPVAYVSNRDSKLYSREPNINGNGKYRNRKGIDRKVHKYKPLKLIKHRYGK